MSFSGVCRIFSRCLPLASINLKANGPQRVLIFFILRATGRILIKVKSWKAEINKLLGCQVFLRFRFYTKIKRVKVGTVLTNNIPLSDPPWSVRMYSSAGMIILLRIQGRTAFYFSHDVNGFFKLIWSHELEIYFRQG